MRLLAVVMCDYDGKNQQQLVLIYLSSPIVLIHSWGLSKFFPKHSGEILYGAEAAMLRDVFYWQVSCSEHFFGLIELSVSDFTVNAVSGKFLKSCFQRGAGNR